LTIPESKAAGLLVADGGFGGVLEIESHEVSVTVNNGVAVTTVDQSFRNTENRQVEALYTFPVPKGASVSNFSMWINGKEMVGEVLEKERARQIYQSYKKTRRDPGLLEQVDYKTFEMRVFPIGPKALQRVRVTYYQELVADNDWVTYVYPLATVTKAGADARTTGRFAFDFEAKSAVPIVAMESPSHGENVVVAAHHESYYQASLEKQAGRNLNKDVVVAYQLKRPVTGIDLIASKEADEDGTFRLTLTAGEEVKPLNSGMDYVFVLDISGSMGDEGKLLTSKESVASFVRELGPEDRFEVMTFNVQPIPLFKQLQEVNGDNVVLAEQFLGSQQARGGTSLRPALSTAYNYADPDRRLNVVVMSDGMTEQRERAELMRLISSRPSNARVFCVGVGNEVNRQLLEQIAEDSGGIAAFLSRGDNFARSAKAFREKLKHPVASGLQLSIEGVEVYDVEPQVLPNLFHGTPITVYGRYKRGGAASVTLTGDVMGRAIKSTTTLDLPREAAENPEIERMWALKRVDRLLKEGDRAGSREGVKDEIIRLGEAFSIVTEYTSFLVLENDREYKRWKIKRKNLLLSARDQRAHEALRADLDKIRERALNQLGPEGTKLTEEKVVTKGAPTRMANTNNSSAGATPAPVVKRDRSSSQRRSSNIRFGSGPVGPLFLVGAALMGRRRKKKGKESDSDNK
jgi:Ca-activated chloride channel family protein